MAETNWKTLAEADDNDLLAIACERWANDIETGDYSLSAAEAKKQGSLRGSTRTLGPNQTVLVARLRKQAHEQFFLFDPDRHPGG